MSRRNLLYAGAGAVTLGGAVVAAEPAKRAPEANDRLEWRNRRDGMAYRRLGRTNMMVSEVVSGGDPITQGNYRHLLRAFEMGLNYFDMAPAYNGGDTERAYGRLLKEAVKRDQVFLTTKISGFSDQREQRYQEIFKTLPEDRKAAIRKRTQEIAQERAAEKPGYYLTYFPGQKDQFEPAYLTVAMMRDYAHQVEGSRDFGRFIRESLEGSLKRVGTDHFDLMMCPHGAATPEELRCPEIVEVFQELKREGKVRFLGVTSHNDPAAILRTAAELPHYEAVMMAYNVVNAGYLEDAIRQAHARDLGVIAMKVAHAVATHHKELQPIPEWRVQKVDRVIPGDAKPPVKAYLWALQNPHISAVVSNLWDEQFVRENLAVAGKKVELQPA